MKLGMMCLTFLWLGLANQGMAEDTRTTTIGMPGRIVDLILPGSPLEVMPIERDAALVVRIVQTIGHGPGQHRYEIEYYGLEPGEYDLSEYLQRTDGTPAELPEIKVTVQAQLASGQVLPNALISRDTPRVGGYRNGLVVAGIVWIVGLLAILFLGRQKLTPEQRAAQKLSLADRLQPLVQRAMQGELSGAEQADLERMLLTYWRAKLDLNKTSASEAILELKHHETAGQLLRQLETWLHMPVERRTAVDVQQLLEPYQNIRAELQDVATLGETTT